MPSQESMIYFEFDSIMPRRMARRPRRARRAPRKHMRRGTKGGVLAVPRSMHASPNQYASLTESILFVDTLPNVPSYRRFDLSQFYRASSVAVNYKWYKAAKCTWTYTPLYNTFQESAAVGTVSKPQILFQMNRTQDSLPLTDSFDMLSMGSKPQAFTNNKVITYVPNWCSPGLIAIATDEPTGLVSGVRQIGLRANTGWLASTPQDSYNTSTRLQPLTSGNQILNDGSVNAPVLPANVQYNGHIDYVYQERAVAAVYSLVLTVTWVFKQPLLYTTTPPIKAPSDLSGNV